MKKKNIASAAATTIRSKPVCFTSKEPIDLKTKTKGLENDFFYYGKDMHTKFLVASKKEFLN